MICACVPLNSLDVVCISYISLAHYTYTTAQNQLAMHIAIGQDFSKFVSKTDPLQQFAFFEISIENRAPDTKSRTEKRLRSRHSVRNRTHSSRFVSTQV